MKNTDFNDLNEIMSTERHLRQIQQSEQAPLEIQKLLEQERAARLAAEAEAQRQRRRDSVVSWVQFGLSLAVAIAALIVSRT